MEVSSARGLTRAQQPATHSAALLMVSGPPGQVGLLAARDVVEDLLPGQDHAMLLFLVVGEPLVLATTEKVKTAMSNAALLLEDGDPGDLGASVDLSYHMMIMNAGEYEEGPATTQCHNVEEAALLEHVLKLLIVINITAVRIVGGKEEGEGGLQMGEG